MTHCRRKKGEVLLSMLNTFKDKELVDSGTLFLSFINAGGKDRKPKIKDPESNEINIKEVRKRKRNFNSMIYKMKRDNLIKEERTKEFGKCYKITKQGIERLRNLSCRIEQRIPIKDYKKKPSKNLVIVTFDIPEDQKRKRRWLRCVLEKLDFRMHHHSFWIGHSKIPKELKNDIYNFGLGDCVDFFRAFEL